MRAVVAYGIGLVIAAGFTVRILTNPASKTAMTAQAKQPFHGEHISVLSSYIVGAAGTALISGTILYLLFRALKWKPLGR